VAGALPQTCRLAWLLEVERLKLKLAIPKDERGIYHEKVGSFLDDSDAYIAFSGSSNAGRHGLEVNYEYIDVYTSLSDQGHADADHRHFELLWRGPALAGHS
jgi:hypothetical protein